MIQSLSYDELNVMAGMKRSVPYDQYFGEMRLPEYDKEERKNLAESLEEAFLPVLALLFTMKQFDSFDWKMARDRFSSAYLSVLREHSLEDSYLEDYVEIFADNSIISTRNNENEPYYYSIDRARFMAENEANTIYNYVRNEEAIRSGKTRKQWIAIEDDVTRPTHRDVDMRVLPINQYFLVGNSLMRYPKDPLGNPEEIINCRCSIIYF